MDSIPEGFPKLLEKSWKESFEIPEGISEEILEESKRELLKEPQEESKMKLPEELLQIKLLEPYECLFYFPYRAPRLST